MQRSAVRSQRSAIRSRLRRGTLAPCQRRRGVALIDVILGGVLLAIGLAVVISLATRSLRSQTDGEKRLIASWLADELLTTVLVEGPINYPKLYDNHGQCESPFGEFEYDVHIEDQGLNAPFRVTASLSWPSGAGYQSVQVQTLIAERGGDPYQPRAPLEPVDRLDRWYEVENPDQ
jgi:hypothetical protein